MEEGRERIPQAGLDVIVDMPAELLRRRPDVRAAEMQLASQSGLIGVTVALYAWATVWALEHWRAARADALFFRQG